MDMKERYWLRVAGLAWQEATQEQFISAEHDAGFRPKGGDGVATGGFSAGGVEGKVTYDEITSDRYGDDPAFLQAVQATAQPV